MKEKDKYTVIYTEELKLMKTQIIAQSATIAVLIILALIICFKSMILAVDFEDLKKEKQTLEELAEMQSSMICDLEENCKDLFIELEDLKYGN